MRNVADGAVLVVEAAVHFLGDVTAVFVELAQRVALYPFDLFFLPRQFVFKLFHKFSLHLLPLVSLSGDTLLDFTTVFSQVLENLPLFLDSCILLAFQIGKLLIHALMNRVQLVIQTLDAITAFTC